MKNKAKGILTILIIFGLFACGFVANGVSDVSTEKRSLPDSLIPGGNVIGVKFYIDGVHVLNADSVETEKGRKNPAKEAGIKSGDYIKEVIGGVSAVKFSASLGDTAACLSTEGELSVEMAKILGRLPGADEMGAPEASIVLEINLSHPIAERLKALFGVDNETLQKYAKMLWGSACLVSGIALENPIEYTSLVAELMSK